MASLKHSMRTWRSFWLRSSLQSSRSSSTTSEAAPPLLAKIRGDMKSAMRAKDTARLNVLRAIISESLNASKGSSPVTTDMQVLAMLKKRKAASRTAADEALQAKREDLAQKQEGEIAILDEYAGSVTMMAENDVRQAVEAAVETLRTTGQNMNPGNVIKHLLRSGGPLEGQPVDKAQVAAMVKETLASN